MIIIKAGYIIGNYLIALAETGICEAPVPDIHEYGVALQCGPFLTKPVLIQRNYQEIIVAAQNDLLFHVYEKGGTHYIRISDNATVEDIKHRYMGFIPPRVLAELHKMAQNIVQPLPPQDSHRLPAKIYYSEGHMDTPF